MLASCKAYSPHRYEQVDRKLDRYIRHASRRNIDAVGGYVGYADSLTIKKNF